MAGYAQYDPMSRREPITAVLRDAAPSDLDALSAIELTAVTRTRDDWATMIEKAQTDEDRLLLVADADGELAGFAQAHFLPQHAADQAPAGYYLTGVTVLPAFRRGGLGRTFTAARLDWIRGRAAAAWYFAASANAVSIHLHDQFGFEEVRRAPRIQGVSFESGEGVLFRADLATPRGIALRPFACEAGRVRP